MTPAQLQLREDLLNLRTHAELAALLGISAKALRHLTHHQNYKALDLPKKDGGVRAINAPQGLLKAVQRRLLPYLAALYGERAPVHGFCAGRSIKTNAGAHIRRHYVFNVDLNDFFTTIHFGRVYGMFSKAPHSLASPVARALTQLCCFNGVLPQGAPTSPVVTNLVCASLDAKLKALARQNSCRFTRYADDITFSSNAEQFSDAIAVLRDGRWCAADALTKVIGDAGFKLNASKTRMQSSYARQSVTGLVVNKKVNIRRSYLQAVKGMLRSLERDGILTAEKRWREEYRVRQTVKPSSFASVLRGRVGHIGDVKGWDTHAYFRLSQRLTELDIRVRSAPSSITGQAARIVIDSANWLVEAGENEALATEQSSGFSWGQHGIVTACHAVGQYDHIAKLWLPYDFVQVSQPHLGSGKKHVAQVVAVHPHADLALLAYPSVPLAAFEVMEEPTEVSIRDTVRVLGFPHYHLGDSCADQDFSVTQHRIYSGIRHIIVGGAIIKGNSGGPVLNQKNRLVGVALKGQSIPAHFSDQDALSSFAEASQLSLLLQPISREKVGDPVDL